CRRDRCGRAKMVGVGQEPQFENGVTENRVTVYREPRSVRNPTTLFCDCSQPLMAHDNARGRLQMIHGMISALVAAVLAVLLATQGAAAQVILLEGARVVAGDGGPPIENAALLVEGGIISRIGRKGDIALPAGGTRIDLDGKTMMPAIISTHV